MESIEKLQKQEFMKSLRENLQLPTPKTLEEAGEEMIKQMRKIRVLEGQMQITAWLVND